MIPVPTETLAALVDGTHSQPHAVLGPHADADGVTIQVLRPDATAVDVVVGGQNQPMEHEHAGVWVTELAGTDIPDYRLAVAYGGDKLPADDPYRFLPTLGEIDQHLIAEGRHEQLWDVLGAHEHRYETLNGPVRGWRSRCGRPTRRESGWSATSITGTAPPPYAVAGQQRGVGGVRPRDRGGDPLQVRDHRARRCAPTQGRSDGPGHRGPAGHRLRGVRQ